MAIRPAIKYWVLRPLIIIVISVVGFTGACLILLLTQQERIVKYTVSELNTQLKGQITVESSKLNLFKHFPYVGVVLYQATLFPDKSNTSAQICKFEKLHVSVSIPDLLEGKYNVRRVSLTGGKLDLVRDEKGNLNLLQALEMEATDSTPTDTKSAAFQIDLQKISFKKIDLDFLDKVSGRHITTNIDHLLSTFKSDSLLMTFTVESDLEFDMTSPDDTTLFRHKKLNLDITSDYKLRQKLLEITNGKFKLQDASFQIAGTANFWNVPEVNLKVKGDEPDFKLLAAFLPGDVKTLLKPFRYDGHIYFEGVVQGELSHEELPFIEISFGCEDAWFLNEEAKRKVDQLAFKGFYTNGSDRTLRTSELHLINMNARPGEGVFKGYFVLRDFTDPKIMMRLQSELELGFLGHFFGIQDLQQFTGTIKLEMDFQEIMDIKLPVQSLARLKQGIQSKLDVENLSFHIPGYPHEVRNMNLHAQMKDGRITVDSGAVHIGSSDIRLSGSLSDVQGFLRFPKKTIALALNASSANIDLKELLSYDTALSNKMDEQLHNFNIGLRLETSVEQLRHPSPLPNGKFEVKNLRASFKKYPHTVKNLNASIMITDTTLHIQNFDGLIDSSDVRLSGHIKNYQLWFDSIKKGRTSIAFDFKTKRFAFDDITVKGHRKFIPRGYRHEILIDAWLQAKVDLKYDTNFRFMKADIATITGLLKKHNFSVKDIKGKVKYGTNVLVLDTLRGFIGKSDFDISYRLYTGKDQAKKKKMNYLAFKSTSLDLDEITSYDFSTPPRKKKKGKDSLAVQVAVVSDTAHAKAFNFFALPFSEFAVRIDIEKLKYKKLWIKKFTGRVRLTADHHLYLDTIGMRIAGGTVGVKGDINGSDTSKLYFTNVIKVDQVDLEKVMLKLDNFGQDVVINKNLKGHVTGQITSRLQVHPNLVPLINNSTAQLDILILDGSLNDFAPMLAMAGYFKDKNLRKVRFDSLKNELSFTNGVLIIPAMNINSSLGAIEMSGKQSMDLTMEYYMRIPMKMVTQAAVSNLFGKKPDDVDSTQTDKVIYMDKDKRGRFVNIKITGTPTDYKIALGKNKSGALQ